MKKNIKNTLIAGTVAGMMATTGCTADLMTSEKAAATNVASSQYNTDVANPTRSAATRTANTVNRPYRSSTYGYNRNNVNRYDSFTRPYSYRDNTAGVYNRSAVTPTSPRITAATPAEKNHVTNNVTRANRVTRSKRATTDVVKKNNTAATKKVTRNAVVNSRTHKNNVQANLNNAARSNVKGAGINTSAVTDRVIPNTINDNAYFNRNAVTGRTIVNDDRISRNYVRNNLKVAGRTIAADNLNGRIDRATGRGAGTPVYRTPAPNNGVTIGSPRINFSNQGLAARNRAAATNQANLADNPANNDLNAYNNSSVNKSGPF